METIQLVFATDNNYVQHLGVTLMSILHTKTSANPMRIHVIGDGLSTENLDALREIAAGSGAEIHFPKVDFETFGGLTVTKRLNRAMYGRLAIPEVIDADKVLYLDCDIIARYDITSLYEIDLSGMYAGAVNDPGARGPDGSYRTHNRLGIPESEPYFNSGVMLLNLRTCRQDHIMERVFEYATQNPQKLLYPDQDALNVVMQGKWVTVHPKWNTQTCMFRMSYKFQHRRELPQDTIEALKDPAIVHFVEAVKPWNYECSTPYAELYYKYLEMTPWKGFRPKDWTLAKMLRKHRRLIERRTVSAFLGYRV